MTLYSTPQLFQRDGYQALHLVVNDQDVDQLEGSSELRNLIQSEYHRQSHLSQVFSAMKNMELRLEVGANTQGGAGSSDQSLYRWDPAQDWLWVNLKC